MKNGPEGFARGQVSVELYVAIALFIVALVWATNYATTYLSTVGVAADYSEAGAIAASAARGINSACAYGTNVTFRLPCAMSAGTMVPVIVNSTTTAPGNANPAINVTIPLENVSVTRTLLCQSNSLLVYQCQSPDGEWACAQNSSASGYTLSLGACNTTNLP